MTNANSTLLAKQELRASLRASRRKEADDVLIGRRLLGLPEFERAVVLFAYLSFGSEVPTTDVILAAWDANKIVAIPRCVPGTRVMTWHRITSFDGLVRSSFGMLEPERMTHERIVPRDFPNPLAVVPGLAFDEQGYRLGYGGGFYDTFLQGFGGVGIGLCRESSMVKDLRELKVLEEHDLPVDVVVTQQRVIRAK